MLSDLEIAQAAQLEPIGAVGAKFGIPDSALHLYGRFMAKLDHTFLSDIETRPAGRLILVTAISPTPAGEGKTTTTIGLGDALNKIGKRTMICLREPSLGPCFGQKGGATGGGYAQVVPMENINLHFTGDFHAIGAANNLFAAMLDNHVYWGNPLGIDTRRVAWRRAVDMNDRALRAIVSSLGGPANGFVREDGFYITVASEVMALFCLARNLADLEARLAVMIGAFGRDRRAITVGDIKATGSMAVLLKDALQPNLVQTLEGNAALVHGGPFANIAHGCNSLMATNAGRHLADYVVTEAGFGADLGAEKFFDIKCRQGRLRPAAAVLVATVRALKMHGGVARADLDQENLEALERGFVNLERHAQNLKRFFIPVVVAINRFASDTTAELDFVRDQCRTRLGIEAHVATHFTDGSAGAIDLAKAVAGAADLSPPEGSPDFRLLYPDDLPLAEKMRMIATDIYGAGAIEFEPRAAADLADFEARGFGHLPICMAKTQYSFSTDPTLRGAPSGHVIHVREARLSAGAGFVVGLCGDVLTMPGLPRVPAAERIGLDASGRVVGLS